MPLDFISLRMHSKILTPASQRSSAVASTHALVNMRANSTFNRFPSKDLVAKAATPSGSILQSFIFYYLKGKKEK